MTNILGTAGSDPALNGTGSHDVIDFSQGGIDTVNGGAGADDLIAGATLTAADQVNGGADADTLYLDGDYSAGITFGANTVTNVETIDLGQVSNNNYAIATHDNTVAAGQTLTVDALSVGFGKYVVFDGSAETDGSFLYYGGSGNDLVTGGAQYDNFALGYGGNDIVHGGGGGDVFNLGADLTTADLIDGGSGNDVLYLDGDYSLTLNSSFVNSIETIGLLNNHTYTLTATDSLVAAGQNLYVSGWAISGTGHMTFDGSAETDGTFGFTDSINNDTIWGGQNDDRFDTYMGGHDIFQGKGGEDTFTLKGSLDALDQINGGTGDDFLTIGGDYSAGLILSNTTITNIETIGFEGGFDYNLKTADGNVAAGQTLDVTGAYLTAGDSLTFDGSAETNGNFNFYGGVGDDTFTGGSGDDYADLGNGGVDHVYGGGGADSVQFWGTYTTADFVDGGAGIDHVYISSNNPGGLTLGSTNFQNVEGITFGGNFSQHVTALDSLVAAGATFAVDGYYLGAGKSLYFDGSAETNASFQLTGSDGNDTLIGGAQADTFIYNKAGNDTLEGNGGADVFYFAPGDLTAADHVDGGAGADQFRLGGDFSQLFTFGAQTMQNVEELFLYWGNDYNLKTDDANVAAGNLLTVSAQYMGAGEDVAFDGSAETDGRFQITTGDGADVLKGGAGDDVMASGNGDDFLRGGAGADTLNGGGNVDTADYSDKSSAVVVTLNGGQFVTVTVGGVAEDSIKNIENVNGGSGADKLTGDANANVLQGGNGDDTLKGGLGADTLNGGGGSGDIADYRDKTSAVAVTLNGGQFVNVTVGGVAEDTIKNIEGVIGGTAGDSLTGDANGNLLAGREGGDTLFGAAGADSFLFNTTLGASNIDHIGDFAAEDTIYLDDTVFSAFAGSGSLSADAFYSAAGATSAHDATDRIVYNSTTGALYYDADGNQAGGVAAVQFAVLDNHAALTNADFVVV